MKAARQVAVEALLHQEQDGYSNLVLDGLLRREALSPMDKRFVSALFYGVLERQNTLDFCLDQLLKKPVAKLDAPVRAILRSGAYQLRYMKVPASAAVNEAVKLTRAFGKTSASGLVNAVLRRVGQIDPTQGPFSSPVHRLSVLGSVSPSVAKCLLAWYGAEAQEILEAFFVPRPTAIRVNPLKAQEPLLLQELTSQGLSPAAGQVPGAWELHFSGSPAEHPAFARGAFYVQGQPSQLAALSLMAQPGQKVLDLCAAPGGKSLTIAGMMQNRGQLFSCDASAARTPLIEQAFARCGVAIGRVLCADAAQHRAELDGADRVLCDVPCSGLGILGKKPDIRYKDVADLSSLYALQAAILENGAAYLKPGGRLVYSTCTINPNENGAVVQAFLERHPDFSACSPVMTPQGALEDGCGITILPNRCGMDGFYIACLERAGQ